MFKIRLKQFLNNYSALTHFILWLWNLFVTSWATGVNFSVGNTQLNARTLVSSAQETLHTPTWVPFLITVFLNAFVAYHTWMTMQAQKVRAMKLLSAHEDSSRS